MKLRVYDEPLLAFGGDRTHIDIRAGLATHGAFDRGAPTAPVPIGIGIVGTTATIDGARDWLERCRNGVVSKEAKLKELRPDFPGVREEVFGTRLDISDSATRVVTRYELQPALLAGSDRMNRVAEVFLNHSRDLAGRGGIRVLVIAPPPEVFALADPRPSGPASDPPLDEGQDEKPAYTASFHDVFKASALDLAAPCQLLRPDTYGGGSTNRGRQRRTLQDEATRAWNFHVALYYKAGGVPWRLVRNAAALTTCYVGASFFKSADGARLLTSVAQVFNERGEGLIVQGGNASINRDDRTPHLSQNDARDLLANGLASYRREHHTNPARVVVHKTSYFDSAEIAGCQEAAKDVELLDLVSVRRAGARLLRVGDSPVVRGTALCFDEHAGLIYLKGTVPYFRTYPGAYVPRALEFSRDHGETASMELARELLELSKLNFNNTQFDSGDPVTVRAARRVGDILKHVAVGRQIQSRFRYFT